MPSFADIKNVRTPDKKLSHNEMLRAIKFAIASEYEAIQIYQLIMESTDNESVKTILTDVTNDEMHHVGQLTKLLEILGPEDTPQYAHGVNQTIEMLNLNAPHKSAKGAAASDTKSPLSDTISGNKK